MIKTRVTLIALFLLVTLITTIFLAPVQASHVLVAWGEETTQQNPAEQEADNYTCSYITADGVGNWYSANFYGSMTTPYNVYTSNDDVRDCEDYDYLATFHVGDMYPKFVDYGHLELGWHGMEPYYYYVIDGYTRHYAYYCVDGNNSEGVIDYLLGSHTSWKNQFTFIWTCASGDWIETSIMRDASFVEVDGYTVNNYYFFDLNDKLVGMPAAWTNYDFTLEPDGYGSPGSGNVCYISFLNTSLGLCDDAEFGGLSNYGEFVRLFYDFAILYNMNIHDSLYYSMVYNGINGGFDASWLYQGYSINGYDCRMMVYGNGGITLPHY
jgi:hypothetical protein